MTKRNENSLAAALGIAARDSYAIRDLADGMGAAFSGRLAQQKFSAVRQSHGATSSSRVVGLEYTR